MPRKPSQGFLRLLVLSLPAGLGGARCSRQGGAMDGGDVPAVPRRDNLQPARTKAGDGGTASTENWDKPAREGAARVGGWHGAHGMQKWVRHSPSLCPSLAPPGAAGRAPAIPSSPEAVFHSQPAPPAVCAVPWGSELSEPPPFRSADSTFEQPAPPVSSPNPELSRSSPGSRPGMLCQAQLTDQSLFSLLLLSLFFLPSQHGKSPLSSNVTRTAFALIKPQISSSKCLTRTDATGSCSLLPVPFPINLMAESASAAGASLTNKGALGTAARSLPSPLERMRILRMSWDAACWAGD